MHITRFYLRKLRTNVPKSHWQQHRINIIRYFSFLKPFYSYTQLKTVKSLYEKEKHEEALKQFLKTPDEYSASFLISKQNNLDTSYIIYNAIQEKTIFLIAAMINECKKGNNNQSKLINQLCQDMISLYNQKRYQSKKFSASEWDRMIQVLCKCKWDKEGTDLFDQMIKEGEKPHAATVFLVLQSLVRLENLKSITVLVIPLIDRFNMKMKPQVYTQIIKLCTRSKDLESGKVVHAHLLRNRIENDVVIKTALMSMYNKCGRLQDAIKVFETMSKNERDVVTWTAMISAYGKNGMAKEALDLFEQMRSDGIEPDSNTYNIVLTLCADPAYLDVGKRIHDMIPPSLVQDVYVKSALINMYSKCGKLQEAIKLFKSMEKNQKDIVIWNIMISAYSSYGKKREALDLFEQLKKDGIEPDSNTYNIVLTICADLAYLDVGKRIHDTIPSSMLKGVYVKNALINMYSKCGRLQKAIKLFESMAKNERDVVTWTAMISAYGKNGMAKEALDLFEQMRSDGIRATSNTYNIVLTICADLAYFDVGKRIHSMIPSSLVQDVYVKSALINMYSKCGRLQEAIEIFDTMNRNERDAVTWTAMISAYGKNGMAKEALDLFEQMRSDGIRATSNTYNIVLTICADLAYFDVGKRIHDMIPPSLVQDVYVKSALINMYSKCGKLQEAIKLFKSMEKNQKNIVIWNTMISAYGTHGEAKEALDLFEQLKKDGLKPDSVTFACLLTACSHGGLIDEALELFDSMDKQFDIKPDDMHRSCLVDALSRAGQLRKAEELVNEIEEPDLVALVTLLGACRSCGDVDLAERIFSKITARYPSESAPYVLLANIYASAGRTENANEIRQTMKEKKIKKIPGMTYITVNGQLYSFVSHDTSHPRTKEVYETLHALNLKLAARGYKADTSWVTRTDGEYSEEEKKQLLCYHSERIAIGFALISTPEGSPITLVKNLRVCGDCHEATKYIAMETGREITVRDANRFHHFTPDGKCSCGDYW